MKNKATEQKVLSRRRSLLAATSGIAGLATAKYWVQPVVQSTLLPAHAQTTAPPTILNLRTASGVCTDAPGFFFSIDYEFASTFGIVSHVITSSSCGDDTLGILAGLRNLGDNLLEDFSSNMGSFLLTGDEFAGSASVTSSSITGSIPLSCSIIVTLTDANGGQASDSIDVSEICGSVQP